MPGVYFQLTMSLDGFITGPDDSVDRLHEWAFGGKADADAEVWEEIYARTGAIVIGKRMFDVGFEPWGDPPPFRGMPVFIVTHERREPLPMKGGTTYRFVTDGLEAALEQAKAAAGEKDVGIWGGADIARQYLTAGLLDEFEIHLVPVLLGDGIRLFESQAGGPIELEQTRTIATPAATHIRFNVKR